MDASIYAHAYVYIYMYVYTHTSIGSNIHLHSTVLRTLITGLKQQKDIKSQSLFHPDAFRYFVGLSYFFICYSFTHKNPTYMNTVIWITMLLCLAQSLVRDVEVTVRFITAVLHASLQDCV